jgi:hypothetical protein
LRDWLLGLFSLVLGVMGMQAVMAVFT